MRGTSARGIAALVAADGTFCMRVTPKANAARIAFEETPEGARVRVHVTAAPEDGKANAAVLKLLAKALGVPKSALSIVRETRRDKLVRVAR